MKTVFPRHGFFVVLGVAFITFGTTSSFALKPRPERAPSDGAWTRPSFAMHDTNLVDQVLGSWDFESPPGQGWTAVDATVQPVNFTHVDDFAGLPFPYVPLSGTKSLWCGLGGPDCKYLTLPGYGNGWDQRFTSVAFPSAGGDVHVDFTIRYDCEPDYDFVKVEFQGISGVWTEIASFNGTGSTAYSALIPDAEVGATARIRFRFTSDRAYSDEDELYPSNGAYVLDDLVVSDGGGTFNVEDFEAEAVNAQTTVDGKWTATVAPGYGLHAALFSGSTVLQEDPGVTNTSQLWGFFNNSTYDYTCGGHPEQLAIPHRRVVDGKMRYIDNEIQSPPINIVEDPYGFPVTGAISVSFDVYRDLPLSALVFYQVRVRSLVDGCWGWWRDNDYVYHDGSKKWFRHTHPLSPQIDIGATQIQVALAALDMCPVWCGPLGTGSCHTQGPLFDNVQVTAALGATDVDDRVPSQFALHQCVPNPFNPSTTIRYDVPNHGARVSIAVFDVTGRRVRSLVDGAQPAGQPSVTWDGRDDGGSTVASGVYFYRMTAGSFVQTRKMVLLK